MGSLPRTPQSGLTPVLPAAPDDSFRRKTRALECLFQISWYDTSTQKHSADVAAVATVQHARCGPPAASQAVLSLWCCASVYRTFFSWLTVTNDSAVPASSDRTLNKSLVTESDVIVYDLEDSVPPTRQDKEGARDRLITFIAVRRKHLFLDFASSFNTYWLRVETSGRRTSSTRTSRRSRERCEHTFLQG